LTVTGLVPFMLYKLRITANNVVGASSPSEPTKEFQTIQAPPAHPPYNVTVRAMSATELRVRWIVSTFGVPFITFRKAELSLCLIGMPRCSGCEYIAEGIHFLVLVLLCVGFSTPRVKRHPTWLDTELFGLQNQAGHGDEEKVPFLSYNTTQ